MFLYFGAYVAHFKAKIWFIRRIPWFTFFEDLDSIFIVFYVKNKWDKCLKLKKVKSQKYIKLISRYETILNWKSNTVSKISNIKLVELMAELIEVIIIWRISKSRWFGKTIVELLPHTWIKIIIEFSINYKSAL